MGYISGKILLEHAAKNHYAVGAFSVHNAETTKAVLTAAQKENAPVILMIGQKVIQYLGLKLMKEIVDSLAKDVDVPVCVHLDHSRTFEQNVQAIHAGFQSVMFDGSQLPYEENVELTRSIAKIAHSLNMGMEGEIGKIGGTEDDITVEEKDAMLTTAEEALQFSEDSGVDYLAVSIGTAHGVYKVEPKLNFKRLQEITRVVKKPIVLHGGSGVPDEQIQQVILGGVAKVNVDTELRQAFTEGLREALPASPKEIHPANYLTEAMKRMEEKTREKIRLFGSAGMAKFF